MQLATVAGASRRSPDDQTAVAAWPVARRFLTSHQARGANARLLKTSPGQVAQSIEDIGASPSLLGKLLAVLVPAMAEGPGS
eukprot:1338959-Pyramimonas_sp.AAC.1